MIVKQLQLDAASHWDEFADSHQDATFFHRAGWIRAIEATTGHRNHSLYVEENDGATVGVLPLMRTRSVLFGDALVSTPFCVYGGVVANNDQARQLLLNAAKELSEQLGVGYLELRHRSAVTDGWPSKQAHATFRRRLDDTEEANMLAMKRKQRAVIRQAIKNGHKTHMESDLDDFYRIYSTSVRNLGTPVFSKAFFAALKREFADCIETLTVRHEGKATAALMSFYYRDEVLPYYGGGLPEARHLKSMDYMYWDQICRSLAGETAIYDFGRSKIGSGPYNYKRHWGFEPEPLCYEYHLVKAKSLPNLSPNNPKYRYFIEGWKYLPLGVSQAVGPFISKYLG